MKPVTLKSDQITATLIWAQFVLVLLAVVFAVTAWLTNLAFLLVPPVLVLLFNRNQKAIDAIKSCDWVLNAEGQWHRVQSGHVTPCHLNDHWIWPNGLLLSFEVENEKSTHHLMVSRSKIPGQDFSRLIQGVKRQVEPPVEIKS